jgi:hypothetical protein
MIGRPAPPRPRARGFFRRARASTARRPGGAPLLRCKKASPGNPPQARAPRGADRGLLGGRPPPRGGWCSVRASPELAAGGRTERARQGRAACARPSAPPPSFPQARTRPLRDPPAPPRPTPPLVRPRPTQSESVNAAGAAPAAARPRRPGPRAPAHRARRVLAPIPGRCMHCPRGRGRPGRGPAPRPAAPGARAPLRGLRGVPPTSVQPPGGRQARARAVRRGSRRGRRARGRRGPRGPARPSIASPARPPPRH